MIKIYCISSFYMQFADLVRERLPDVPIVNIKAVETGVIDAEEERELLENAEVVVGDPKISVIYMYRCRKLKWFHSIYAGVDAMLKNVDPLKGLPTFILTRRLIGIKLSAEFVLSYILAIERRLFQLFDDQKNKAWHMTERAHCRTLDKVTVGLLGVGGIGEEVAKTCKERGMKVIGLVRSLDPAKNRSSNVDVYLTYDKLSELLMESDYICCVLPSTHETRNVLSGDILAHCHHKVKYENLSQPKASQNRNFYWVPSDFLFERCHCTTYIITRGVLISIGRGDIVDEESIVKAIRNRWIGGAVLDVFPEEPLPANSPLWSLPNVYITPHISGWSTASQFKEEMVDEFVSNFRLYESGKPVPHIIDWAKGY